MTGHERQLLSSIMDRILPAGTDAGAADADAIVYAEWFFDQPSSRPAWETCVMGLQLVDDLARALCGKSFLECDSAERDEILGRAQMVPHPAVQRFFVIAIRVTLAGFLCAPRHGGNRDGAGWKAIGFTPHPHTVANDPGRTAPE